MLHIIIIPYAEIFPSQFIQQNTTLTPFTHNHFAHTFSIKRYIIEKCFFYTIYTTSTTKLKNH